jgi:hypothetical protein
MPGLFESENLSEIQHEWIPKTADQKKEEKEEKEEIQKERENENFEQYIRDYKREGKIELKSGELKSLISIEPTWAPITTKSGTVLIGIKVIPYPVNAEKFVKAILVDSKLQKVDKFLSSYERAVTRLFYSFIRKIPILKKIPLKKDPFSDIVYARSRYGQNVFCLLNLASIKSDELFFSEMGGVDRLYDLGWNTICIADDVNKRLYTCMKEYGGLCSTHNYSYLIASLGTQFTNAYKELEDIKKGGSPLAFKKNMVSPHKIFAMRESQELLNKYSKLNIPCLKGDC